MLAMYHSLDLKKAGSAPKAQSIRMPIPAANLHKENSRIEKFKILIESDSTDLGMNQAYIKCMVILLLSAIVVVRNYQ